MADMSDAHEERYLRAWGRDRAQVEAYLYAGNEIVAEYEMSGSQPYVAIVECQDSGGFGAQAQGARLASGMQGSPEPTTLAEAERLIVERTGARLVSFRGQEVARPGSLTRLSSLAAPPQAETEAKVEPELEPDGPGLS